MPLSNSTGKEDQIHFHVEDLGGDMTMKLENVQNNNYLLPHYARLQRQWALTHLKFGKELSEQVIKCQLEKCLPAEFLGRGRVVGKVRDCLKHI